MKLLHKILAGLLLLFVMAVGSCLYFFPFRSCTGTSKAAAYARSLPAERLQKLYFDMEKFSTDPQVPPDGWWVGGGKNPTPLPAVFSDLQVKRIRPREGNIMVQGCLDEFMYLQFSGLGGTGPRTITLSYPEGPNYAHRTEVLWRQ